MKNIFNLRFRYRKLTAVLGILVTAIALSPLIQAVNAASVNLDMDLASRVATGPGAHSDFRSNVSVQHGNVVIGSILVHNTEDAFSGPTAQDFRIKFSVPKGLVTSATVQASVHASNASGNTNFKTSDQNTYTTANGKPFMLSKPRNLKIQRNTIAEEQCNNATFNFDQGNDLPADRFQVNETANSYEFTVDPNGNGQLRPSFCRSLRVAFLTDVNQGPHVTIEKKVQNEASATFVNENTAKEDETLKYVVRVANEGPGPANNVIIRDVLPPASSVQYLPGSCEYKTSGNPTLRPCPGDNFVNGGMSFTDAPAGSVSYIYIKAKVKTEQCATHPTPFFINGADVRTNETPIVHDTVKTTVVCAQQTPTPTPTPTETPTVTPTPTPPVETVTPTPPAPTPPTPAPPGAPKASVLPVTGQTGLGLVALIALLSSTYLYFRERRAFAQTLQRKVGKK